MKCTPATYTDSPIGHHLRPIFPPFASVEGDDEETSGLAEVLDILYATWPSKQFQAGDVASLIKAPMQGEEHNADVLRAYFEMPSRRGPGTVTPKSIGRRLAAISGAPVIVGRGTMKLVRPYAKSGQTSSFAVHVL